MSKIEVAEILTRMEYYILINHYGYEIRKMIKKYNIVYYREIENILKNLNKLSQELSIEGCINQLNILYNKLKLIIEYPDLLIHKKMIVHMVNKLLIYIRRR